MQKKKGNYNIIQIDPSYVPAEIERKQVYGITFEQGRNELAINDELFSNIVTKNKRASGGSSYGYENCHDHLKVYTVQFRVLR